MTPNPFPRGYRSTPVPNPLLADLLVEITDPDELRLTLRTVWALLQQKGFPQSVTMSELAADRTVAAMLGTAGEDLENRVSALLSQAAGRGTLLKIPVRDGQDRYFLNTEPVRRALARQGVVPELMSEAADAEDELEAWQDIEAAAEPSLAITAYKGKHWTDNPDGCRKNTRRDRRLHGVGGHRRDSHGGSQGYPELELHSRIVAAAAEGAGQTWRAWRKSSKS